ncbi:MAG: hypothetical protein EOM25_10890 [Deltaproteobacteria bacterium]|nr:hypothetical protein [Deltaproteobacteria bacterium]
MQLNSWDKKVNVTLYMETRHVETLDQLAVSAGVSRQWVLREILEKVLTSASLEVAPPRLNL